MVGRERKKKFYYEELTHMIHLIMEDEKSRDRLLYVTGKVGKWVVYFQSKTKDLRITGDEGVNLSPRAREDSSSRQAKSQRHKFLFLLPFCSMQALNGLKDLY